MSIPGAASPLFIGAAAAGAAAFQIDRSVRLNDGDSAYFNRTPSSAGNRKKWTWSGWVKRSSLFGDNLIFGAGSGFLGGGAHSAILFQSDSKFQVYDYSGSAFAYRFRTTAVFRDPSAWYHLVVAIDTTQSAQADRVKMYVNNDLQDSFDQTTYASQNYETYVNNSSTSHQIGHSNADTFDGYLAEVNFVDGQQLAPTDFGEYDDNNVWQPKEYSGTYGTNGFHLDFSDNSSNAALGTDSSGNSNTWTVNNLTAAVVPVDVGGDPTVSSSDKPFTTGFSVAFDGNDKMRMEGPGTVSGDFTWECWVKFTGTPDGRFFSAEESVNGTEYSLMRFYNGNLNVYAGDNNGYEANTYTGTISADTWHHIAMVRSGSTLSHYLDGSRWGTNTYSNSFPITTLVLAHGYSGEYFTGSVSNARFVNGQALYTGTSYTVPTATLTTTSQSATASNVTTLVAHKSSLTANDGTKTGILNSSSDIDSLIDTPTNYTADSGNNGGNYSTMNPLLALRLATLSNGNLDVTGGSLTDNGWGTIAVPSGKWYAEVTVTAGGGSTDVMVGVKDIAQQGSTDFGAVSRGYGYSSSGQKVNSDSLSSYAASYTNGDVIGIALDLDAGTITFYKNGSSQGAAFSGISSSYSYHFCCFCRTTSDTVAWNFGQRSFAYTPPSNHLAVCTTNLADPTIADGSTAFDAKLYTGNASTQSVSLNFGPDLLWLKSRSSTKIHTLCDSVRGDGKLIYANSTLAEQDIGATVVDLASSGFNLGYNSGYTAVSHNHNSDSLVAWAWDAGTSTVSNTDGSITSSVRANQSAGFSIVSYTGDGSTSTVGHGLNAAPKLLIIKNRSASVDWVVYTTAIDGSLDFANLNTTSAFSSSSVTAPTSSVFSVVNATTINTSGNNYIAYCFDSVDQYSRVGVYTGNGNSTSGPFVYTGFRPRWILVKSATESTRWYIWDTARDTDNRAENRLSPSENTAESTTEFADILSNGFKLRIDYGGINDTSQTYVYAAFAEHPFKTARAR